MLKYAFWGNGNPTRIYQNSDGSFDVEELQKHHFKGTVELVIVRYHFDDESELDEYIERTQMDVVDESKLTEEIPF